MDEPIESYNPTMLTGLGLFLTLCMPAIFMIAVIGDDRLPYSMGTIIFSPIVGAFTTPVGLLVLFATFLLRKKHPEKPIRWRSALSGSCVATALGSLAWFLKFSFIG
jgi:hypothetical protein